MKRVDPAKVFDLTLPNGEVVKCWRTQAEQIRRDVRSSGTVVLIRDPETGVCERIDPAQARPA